MINSIAMARATWLTIAVTFALRHVTGRDQLAAHLDALARDRLDAYFSGLADSVRLAKATFITAPPAAHWN